MNDRFNPQRRLIVRAALTAGAALPCASLTFPSLAFAGPATTGTSAGTGAADKRFVMVILRGGLDGLSAVPAVGDPAFAAARGPLAEFASPTLPLDAGFALHPNLAQLHALHGRGELAVVQAVGLPYHERSHFDAQQVLESGGSRPYELSTGWLGRALGHKHSKGLALNTTTTVRCHTPPGSRPSRSAARPVSS